MARFREARKAVVKPEEAVTERIAEQTNEAAPGPNPMVNLMIADIALRGGNRLLRHAVERGLLGKVDGPRVAPSPVKAPTIAQTLLGTALTRIATRSVPGALIVGGGLLAKALYDRKRARDAGKAGEKAVEKQPRRRRS